MHQTSLDMLRIHTLFLDVQEHRLRSQFYDQESSCAWDNLKYRKKQCMFCYKMKALKT